MERRTKIISIAAAAMLVAGAAGGVAVAQTADDDAPLTGDTYDRAVSAALDHAGGGEVTETEVGDDGAAYEVEVRMDDGTEFEVNLDENFVVIGSEIDDDTDKTNEADEQVGADETATP